MNWTPIKHGELRDGADAKLLEAKAQADRAEAAKEESRCSVIKTLAAIPPEIRGSFEGYKLPSEHPDAGAIQLDNDKKREWNRLFLENAGRIFGPAAVIHLIWAVAVCFCVYTYAVWWVAR
jgi:hypothetical protein